MVVRAQPAHRALGFFSGALSVQRRQAGEQFFFGLGLFGRFVGQRRGCAGLADQFLRQIVPAVGCEYGDIEFVVQGFEYAHQPGLMDGLVFGGQGFACAQFFKHVVQAGECESGGLPPLPQPLPREGGGE